MQGFKGLLPRNLLTDDAFTSLNRKTQEYRKITQLSIDFFQVIQRIFDNLYSQLQKSLQAMDLHGDQLPDYYCEFIDVFQDISSETKSFNERITGSFKQMNSVCGVVFSQYSNAILNFTQLVRSYQNNQQILQEMSKKYFRSMKNVLASIQAYKLSFTDVKLIYNQEERVKRYNTCKSDFEMIEAEHSHIQQKVQKVNEIKQSIVNTYNNMHQDVGRMLHAMGSKKISEAKNFTGFFCTMHKSMITMFAQKKLVLDKVQINSIFSHLKIDVQEQHFQCEIDKQKCKDYPAIFFYHKFLKEQFSGFYSKALVNSATKISQKISERKSVNKRVFQFTQGIMKIFEKSHIPNIKEALAFFQKNKKKISDIFSARFVSFMKSIYSILSLSQGINEKLIKSIQPKLNSLQQYLTDDAKKVDLLGKQFQSQVEKMFGGKKQIKKIKNMENEFTQQEKVIDNVKLKKQISEKADFLLHLIQGFDQKMSVNYKQIKDLYNSIINDIFLSANDLYSLSCQYKDMYFGTEQFQANYKKYQTDLETVVQKERESFKQLNFGILISEAKEKLAFDGQTHKFQQFKKLKKPVIQKKQQPQKNIVKSTSLNLDSKITIQTQLNVNLCSPEKLDQISGNQNSVSKQLATPNKQVTPESKYMEFLASKIKLLPNQQFVRTYTCALSDNILLQGRLYITNERICFHSKFNPSNVFFGGTFLQVPKSDIKKIQKRTNALFFNNSVSITTVNGQIYLTSLFSRDETIQIMCRTFQINQDHALQDGDQQSKVRFQEEQIGQLEDDIKQQQQIKRNQDIQKLFEKYKDPKYQFKQVVNSDIQFEGLNALKLLKIFYLGNQVIINRRTYKHFLLYYKQLLQIKQLSIPEWQPSINQHLNPKNIKASLPLQFKRKVIGTFPIPPSGVPFMPKFGKSQQNMALKVVSKDKWVLETLVKTSGAPYTDTFQVHLQTVVQTKKQNVCNIRILLFLEFLSRPMVANIIQTRTLADTTQFNKICVDEMKKYLKNIQKLKQKAMKASKGQDGKQTADDGVIQQLQKDLQEKTKQNKILRKEIQQTRSKQLKERKILLASILLNILFIFIWLK